MDYLNDLRALRHAGRHCLYNGAYCTRRGCVGGCQANALAQEATARGQIPDWIETRRLAAVALRESSGASITCDWMEAALRVCEAVAGMKEPADHPLGAPTGSQP